ncbi:hypothetical protein GLYMA_10G238300v4 [Glycine max]|uniref:DUF4005 domain-containing protein n=1 Tax=Glycine max TaxID=3847 RepID=K7LL46_SOYBN|nr:protein IQ-DOMAIN 1 [Glycine max]KAG4984212.1 hypothetical protein JHK87_028961 [Glycine soja]KAG5152822.1 hypothetical protein JHK84_029294 [Glycine max]KRH35361.1 hypothetical protein GLYMA_10G238300v4 [Glycine max]|eukprot:XP_006589561.1 protein IQ-DOMAIN 1 [Glycine max]
MGFLRRLFGAKKPSDCKSGKKRWTFLKHTVRNKSLPPPPIPPALNTHFDSSTPLDANKHAIAVAAATAAVAEAALAAAHAAAEVVRLTSGGVAATSTSSRTAVTAARVGNLETAAVRIQSAFRGYLARRALRALKALVKLQALVRGHIVRKQSADMLRRMQTLVRLQAQARASRAHLSDNTPSFNFNSSLLSHYPVPEEYEHPPRGFSTKFDGSSILKRCSSNANSRNVDSERVGFDSNWLNRWMELDNKCSQTGDASLKNNGRPDDDKSDKILEVDTWRPHFKSHHNSSSSSQAAHYYLNADYNNENFAAAHESPSKRSAKALNQSFSSREVLQLRSLKFHKGKEEASSRTADNSPQAFSANSRNGSGARRGGGPFTPTRSECSLGFFSGYTGHPNYMANTESFRAKVRSQSAPRQRLEFDRYGSTRRPVPLVGPNSDHDSDLRNKVLPPFNQTNRIGSSNLR